MSDSFWNELVVRRVVGHGCRDGKHTYYRETIGDKIGNWIMLFVAFMLLPLSIYMRIKYKD